MCAGHPDKNPTRQQAAQAKFTEISNANEILTSERQQYNEHLRFGGRRQNHFGFQQQHRYHRQQHHNPFGNHWQQQQHFRSRQSNGSDGAMLGALTLLVFGCIALWIAFMSNSAATNTSPKVQRADLLKNGTRVRAHGLKAKPELNGKQGRVVGFDLEKGRYIIQFGRTGERPVGLKLASLQQMCTATVVHGEHAQSRCQVVGAIGSSDVWSHLAELETERSTEPLRLPPHHVRLADGTRCKVVGVKSRPELNGSLAKICSWDPDAERYNVQFHQGPKIALRPTSCQV